MAMTRELSPVRLFYGQGKLSIIIFYGHVKLSIILFFGQGKLLIIPLYVSDSAILPLFVYSWLRS